MNNIWRLQFLARLAAERSYLLRQLWGLDESVLTTMPVIDEWTAKDILAHLAFWDSLATEGMSHVVHGRSQPLPFFLPEQIETLNREHYEQFKDVPLETVLATLLKERSGFLAIFKQTSDEDLHRQLPQIDGRSIHTKTLARRRYLRDGKHAEMLATWRKQLPDELKRPHRGPKYILRALLLATRKEFLATANLIPETERTSLPVCGVWTLKDLIGHLTDWEKVGLDGLQQLARNQTPEFDYTISFPFDEFNNKNAAARQEQSWEEVWEDFHHTRQQFLAQFDLIAEEQFSRQFTSPWQSPLNGYFWSSIWPGHDHEHGLDIRTSVTLRPRWPQRLWR